MHPHFDFLAMGRGPGHGHRHGWGRGGGFWDQGGGMPGARKLSAADLQLVILSLLEQAPAHGYELIKAIEEKSGGFYTPSPGVIYPALTYLDEIGYAAVEPEGNRKLYSITDAGKAHLNENRASAESILDGLTRIGGRMDDVRDAFAGRDVFGAHELHEASRALKHALKRRWNGDPQEMRRIAQILMRAAAEILGE